MPDLLPDLARLRADPAAQTADDHSPDDQVSPSLPYYHMWTDTEGVSRLNAAVMARFGQKSVGGGAAPQWLRPFPGEVEAVSFAVLPVGWVGEWHESPKPQWVVPLSGRWFLETMDGVRAEMGPGDLHFGQDQDTKGEKGHRSGQLGDEPCVQLIVQFRVSPGAATAEPF